MTKVDQYKHLNKKNELGSGLGMEEVARLVVAQNYGAHRFLSAMVPELREKHEKWGKSPLADGIQKMLDEGMFY